MAVRRFQDLIAWQKARTLTARIYDVTRQERFARDLGLAGQMQRASVSVMANLAEGFDRNRPAEFQRFGHIAKGSCAEVVSHLYVALDVGYLDESTFQALLDEAEEVSRTLSALLRASACAATGSGLGTRDVGPARGGLR